MKLDDFVYLVDDEIFAENAPAIEKDLLHNDATWSIGRQILGGYKFKTNIDPYDGWQMNHMFFFNADIYSHYWGPVRNMIFDVANKYGINVHSITRAKANLTFPDIHNPVHSHTPHVDHTWKHFAGLYYINDSDGDTLIYNEKYDPDKDVELTVAASITPKAGRFLLFNGLNYHSPQVPVNNYRAVINFTFIGEFE